MVKISEYHERRFPGESDDYRKARNALLEAEMKLRRQIEQVAHMRRQLPLGGAVEIDYEFQEIEVDSNEPSPVRLSELFVRGDALIVYGFMYGPDWDQPCPMCTSIADGLNGNAQYVRQATNLVIVAKAAPEKLRTVAIARGWHNLRILSSGDNRFNRDYYAEYEGDYGDHHPMINVFTRRDGQVFHFWASELFFVPEEGMHPRHADLIWPLWNLLDLTPHGRGDFLPEYLGSE